MIYINANDTKTRIILEFDSSKLVILILSLAEILTWILFGWELVDLYKGYTQALSIIILCILTGLFYRWAIDFIKDRGD